MKIVFTFLFSILSIGLFIAGIFSTLGYYKLDLPPILLVLNFPSIALIIGGTFFQLFVTYPFHQIGKAFLDFLPRISSRKYEQGKNEKQIDEILLWQSTYQKSRQNAWAILRKKKPGNFESYLFKLLETNYSIDEFVELYQARLTSLERSFTQSSKVFQTLGGSSPAFGMMGTVIGLMVMFSNFENDVQLASGIGLALMTTLYGIFFAQLIWIPAAKRVQQFYSELKFNHDLLLESIVLILEDKSPMYIRDFLSAKIENK